MISVAQAETLIAAALPAPRSMRVPLDDARGYRLSEAITAERDHPPFDRITHDGIAIDSKAAVRTFPVLSYAAAGAPRASLSQKDCCIEVATGAPLPAGTDTVIPYEMLRMEEADAHLAEGFQPVPGQSLHRKGVDAGAGQALLQAGMNIGAIEIAILAANGVHTVPIFSRPSIGLLATGDELVEVDAPLEEHQLRRSNDRMLSAALRANGFRKVESDWVPDDKERIETRLSGWLKEKDAILLIGGVSRGKYDYVAEVLEASGVEKIFHRVAQRPGKPLWFGRTAKGVPVFGLPGNPASCLTCLHRYMLPALIRMSGGNPVRRLARLATPCAGDAALTLFLPVRWAQSLGDALPMPTQGSGDFTSLQGSDGFIELPPREGLYETGEMLAFYPWEGL